MQNHYYEKNYTFMNDINLIWRGIIKTCTTNWKKDPHRLQKSAFVARWKKLVLKYAKLIQYYFKKQQQTDMVFSLIVIKVFRLNGRPYCYSLYNYFFFLLDFSKTPGRIFMKFSGMVYIGLERS